MITCECGRIYSTQGPRVFCECGYVTELPANKRVVKSSGKPGTELTAIIPKFFSSGGCGCKSYARKMDRWGVAGCEARFDEIVDHLCEQASKQRVIRLFGAVNRVVARQWLTKAIENAKPKHPERIVPESMSAVWVYWAGGAEADEIRYSIRSAHANFKGMSNAVICGDKPDWYTGQMIDSPRFNKQQARDEFGTSRWSKWVDSIVKLQRIIDSPDVTDQFLWLYDDTFIWQPITIDQAMTPRRNGQLAAQTRKPEKRTWRECLRRTAVALKERGLPTLNYSHHAPMVYDKHKLQQTIDLFNPREHPRAIESLYGNHHFAPGEGKSTTGWLNYTCRPRRGWDPGDVPIANVGGFPKPVLLSVSERFPDPSPAERDRSRTNHHGQYA